MFLSHRPLGTSDDLDFKLDLIFSESFILFRKTLCVQTWALYSVKILDQGKKNVNSDGVRSMAVGTEAMSWRGPVK